LATLVAQLPKEIGAAIFIVQHLSAESTGWTLVDHLQKVGTLPCQFGESGQRFERGRVYIAPPDHHMLVKKGTILITKGARENRSRPSIDPLFRPAGRWNVRTSGRRQVRWPVGRAGSERRGLPRHAAECAEARRRGSLRAARLPWEAFW